MLCSHASQPCCSAALRIPQDRRNSGRAELEEIAGPVICNIRRHCHARSRWAVSRVCQQTLSGFAAGRKLSSREEVAGPGKYALPHFGACLLAFALGQGLGIHAITPADAAASNCTHSPRRKAGARISSSRPCVSWRCVRARSIRGARRNNFHARDAGASSWAGVLSDESQSCRRARVNAARTAGLMKGGTSCNVGTGRRSSWA